MTALYLPTGIGYRASQPALIHYGSELEGTLGGPSQWVDRLGDRYRISMTFPPMTMEPKGRQLVAVLKQAKKVGLRVPIAQDGVDTSHGALTYIGVSGGGQTGSSLAVASLPTNYTILAGQYFTLIHNGRGYLHSVAQDTVSDAAGFATLPLIEMLRVIPDNGAECVFRDPFLEGYPQGSETAYDILTEPMLGEMTITIKEAR